MEVLTRQHYADIVDSWIGKGNIIALVGSSRVGKSYVLKDFIQGKHNCILIDEAQEIDRFEESVCKSRPGQR